MNNRFGQIFWAVCLYIIIIYAGIFATKMHGKAWWFVALALLVSHILLSIVTVGERELGALFFWGRARQDLESGPHFAFWPFCYIRKETKNLIQLEIGVLDESEKQKAKALESSISVYLLEDPLRVNWGSMKTADPPATSTEKEMFSKNDPYADNMVTDTRVTVRFRISSLTKLISKAGGLNEGIELIQKVTTSTLVAHAGKSFVGRAIRNMEQLDEKLRKAVEEFVVDPDCELYKIKPENSWGINVEKTQITRLGTSKRVNEAIANKDKTVFEAQGNRIKTEQEGLANANTIKYKAEADKIRLTEEGIGTANAIKQKAEADKIRLTREGEGNAEAARLLLFAQQEGLKKLSELAGIEEGKLLLQIQALEKGMQAGNTFVLPLELSKLVSAIGDKLSPTPPEQPIKKSPIIIAGKYSKIA